MNRPVAIAISSFHSDDAVIALLEAIFADPHPEVGPVIVVDSLGSGKIAESAASRRWPLQYENANTNLGSAGNLARRMSLASQAGAEWCLCLNHDANWEADRLSSLLTVGRSRVHVGAVYPILDHNPRKPRWEAGRQHFKPSAGARLSKLPEDGICAEVLWSSSNSALYSTAPLSEGVAIMADLWMGYEDLAYGIALYQNGWIQLSCRSAVVSSIFEYGIRKILGRVCYIPEKPAWYSYYNIRNLILIRRRYGSNGVSSWMILSKLVQSIARILLFENTKTQRIRLLLWGAVEGLLGKTGKGPRP